MDYMTGHRDYLTGKVRRVGQSNEYYDGYHAAMREQDERDECDRALISMSGARLIPSIEFALDEFGSH